MKANPVSGRPLVYLDLNPLRRNGWEMMPFSHNSTPYWKDPVTGRQLMTDRALMVIQERGY